MPSYSDREKLRMLLPHWIEHNQEHASEFRDWAGRVGRAGEPILAAADFLDQANHSLQQALERFGGPSEGEHE
ncbi:MAG: hypothetical protein ACK2T2_05605 [Anaerolineales bacterium]